jgi:hypothetical protein
MKISLDGQNNLIFKLRRLLKYVLGTYVQDYSGRGVNLTTPLPTLPRLRIVEIYFDSSICLHSVVLS